MDVTSCASFDPADIDEPFSGVFERRSRVATMPSRRDAPTSAGGAHEDSWDGIEPDAPSSLFGNMPEWCVDLGDEMVALHAVELYARLATGAIDPQTKVWRVGREAWVPASEVPELRYAIEDARASEVGLEDLEIFTSELDDVEAALAFAKAG